MPDLLMKKDQNEKIAVVAALFAVALSACGKKETPAPAPAPAPAVEAPAAAPAAAPLTLPSLLMLPHLLPLPPLKPSPLTLLLRPL